MQLNSNHLGIGVASLVLLALVGALLATPVAAETVALPQNETFSVSNDTQELRAVGENASGELTVTVYNATNSSDLVEVTNGTLNATDANGGTDTFSFAAIDAANVTQYKLSVDGTAGIELLELEKVQVISGGGGLLPTDSEIMGVPVVVAAGGGLSILVLAGGALLLLG